MTALLKKAIGDDLQRRGVWVSDAGGNDTALDLLDGLSKSGLKFAGFADDEGTHLGRWATLNQTMTDRLFRWKDGCLEENIIRLLDDSQLELLINDPTGENTGTRLRSLAFRLGLNEKSFSSIAAHTTDLKQLIIEAATGAVPDSMADAEKAEKKAYKSHAQCWFKHPNGGAELAAKVFDLGVWPKIRSEVMPFLNSIRAELSLEALEDLSDE